MPKKQAKKKVAKKKARKKAQPAEIHPMKLKGVIFYKLKAAFAEFENAKSRRSQNTMALNQERLDPKYSPLLRMLSADDLLAQEVKQKGEELAAIYGECFDKLGIAPQDANQYAIDTETGAVNFAGEPKN